MLAVIDPPCLVDQAYRKIEPEVRRVPALLIADAKEPVADVAVLAEDVLVGTVETLPVSRLRTAPRSLRHLQVWQMPMRQPLAGRSPTLTSRPKSRGAV